MILSKWISVKDRLPNLEEYVLASCESLHSRGKYIDVVRMNNNVKTKWWSDRYNEPVIVNYWTPLPPCPEDAEVDKVGFCKTIY